MCYSAILNVESYCNSIVKPKTLFYSLCSLSFWLSLPLFVSHIHSSSLLTPSLTFLLFKACTGARFWILEVGSVWIGGLGLDRWTGIGWWWVWIGRSVGLNRWICWSVGGLVGLIISSSDGDFFFEWVWFWFWFDGGGVALEWWTLLWLNFTMDFA